MGLLGKLFGQKKTVDPIRLDELAVMHRLFSDRNYSECIQLGLGLLKRHPSQEQKEEIENRMGLAYFQNAEYIKAVAYLEPLTRNSQDPGRYFNLATSAIMGGFMPKGLDALEKALELYPKQANDQTPPPPYMLFFAMQALIDKKAYPEAFGLLERLFALYAQLNNTDPTFLESKQIPSLHSVLDKAMGLFFNPIAANALLKLRDKVDQAGQETIDSLVEHLKQANKWPV